MKEKEEIWKDIKGFESLYQISNLGRIKTLSRIYTDTYKKGRTRIINEYIKELKPAKNGYIIVHLIKNRKRYPKYIHRLVAEAFIPNSNNLPFINHKDENPTNNNVENLEWCDCAYNNMYGNAPKKRVQTRIENGSYKNVTLKTRQRLSEALKGKPKSKEHCKNISLGRLGIKFSNSHIEHMSDIQRGRIWVNNGIISKHIFPVDLDNYTKLGFQKGRILKGKVYNAD